MAKEGGNIKFDPNTEAFQMRAQWKKADVCRKQWYERWSWLLDEREKASAEADRIRQGMTEHIHTVSRPAVTKSLKPVPVTSTGFIGWLGKKPNCKLEIYTPWLSKIPVRLKDVWQDKEYFGKTEQT